ncbi:sugar phosphate nucleotidyltransferase [Flavihumibacter sp. ZG627]|uniref:nucleotidyltransferase family protein n=1 Tax=Flavihumibacter sp. ZG627 TaxID=1463156 RepID=UPI0020A009E5|nr:sugar phosphate nucleotidyltransferase [Flavihumibacter sp. ZG627]
MLFSAGLGTRFKPWTDKHPKALAMVNGKSLLQRNIEYFQRFGITEVVVNVHHFADQVIEALDRSGGWGSKIIISDEREELLETGGGLLKARPFLESPAANSELFVTINADILTDLDLNKLIAFHKEQEALVSFGVTDRLTSRNFLFDAENRLRGWVNTATGQYRWPSGAAPANISALVQKAYSCVVVFDPRIFGLMRHTGKFSIVDTYLDLANDHRIMGYDHSGDRLVDVGKPESVALAEAMFP